jgi:hypothetical protein
MSHPWRTLGAYGMRRSLASRELCLSALRTRLKSSGRALLLQGGSLGAPYAYQREGAHGV